MKVLVFFSTLFFSHTVLAGCFWCKPTPPTVPTVSSAENGCSFNVSSVAFKNQDYSNPSSSWSFNLGSSHAIGNPTGLPIHKWTPDGQITSIKQASSGTWINFYPGSSSYRTTGSNALPDSQQMLNPSEKILGGKHGGSSPQHNDGGEWLMSAFDVGNGDGRLIGFGHAEDHYYGQGGPVGSPPIAFKSFTVVCGENWGTRWGKSALVLSDGVKPDTPQWRGIGDGAVVWDFKNNRWLAMLMNKREDQNGSAALTAAVSYDKSAKPSSWKKWDGSSFNAHAVNNRAEQLRDLNGNKLFGANPSLSWNTHIQRWVMVYHAWNGDLMITAANDLPHFENPKVLLRNDDGKGAWYPTMMSSNAGVITTQQWNSLYFRKWLESKGSGASQFKGAEIKICRGSSC